MMDRVVEWIFALRTVFAVAIALLIGGVLMLLAGSDPVAGYQALFGEAFFDYWGIGNTLVKTSPILLAGLAVVVPLRAGLYNIGGEGQIYLGGLFATVVGLALPEMPSYAGIPIVVVAAMIGGGLWAAIPGYLRAYHGINEVIVTLLMNFIGIHIVSYAVSGPLLAKSAPYPYSEELPEFLHLPILMPETDTHIGAMAGLLIAVVIYLFFRYTPSGFAIDTVGRNPEAAQYAGIAVRKQMLRSMILGGCLAGLAGGFEVIGLKYRLFHLFSSGYGFDGIVVAFMALASPILVPVAAFFLAGLQAGAGAMQRVAGVERSIVDALQGLVVIMLAASLAMRADRLGILSYLRARRASLILPAAKKAS